MTLKQLIDEMFPLNEEEELERKLLSDRMRNALNILDKVIAEFAANMQLNKNPKARPAFPDSLKTLLADAWELKELSKNIPPTNPKYPLALKTQSNWDMIHKRLNKFKAKILEWNRKHPNNQFPSIEELTGLNIRESIFIGEVI